MEREARAVEAGAIALHDLKCDVACPVPSLCTRWPEFRTDAALVIYRAHTARDAEAEVERGAVAIARTAGHRFGSDQVSGTAAGIWRDYARACLDAASTTLPTCAASSKQSSETSSHDPR